jgi:hypothetical protein
VGEHIFKYKTTLTDFQAYPAIADPTEPSDLEVTFKVTITSKCTNALLIEPTPGFGENFHWIESPNDSIDKNLTQTIKSFN